MECLRFPWPNVNGKLRSLALLDPYDELAVRTAVAEVVGAVDGVLPERPVVSGYRLGKPPPGWAYRQCRKSYAEHRSHVKSLVRTGRFTGLLITDIARFYASIRRDVCATRLMSIAGPSPAVAAVFSWWEVWEHRDGLEGLPIGPEWSPTFAHALLSQVDRALVISGFAHGRWSDDIAVRLGFPRDEDRALATIDSELEGLRLERSEPKTDVFDDPEEALAKVQDSVLGGLQSALRGGQDEADDRVHDLFLEAADDPNRVNRFRFTLRAMGNRCDPRAAEELAMRPELMETDPTTVGEYLKAIAPRHPDAVATLMPLLGAPPTARTAAVQVHLLRAATARPWGVAEGALFEKVHDDLSRPAPVRWWAAEALAASPLYDSDRCVADVGLAADPQAARRMALPLRRTTDDAVRATCAWRIDGPELRLGPTAAYIARRGRPVAMPPK